MLYMKTSFLSKSIIISFVLISIISCKEKSPQFTIEGTISNADSTMLYLERRALNETTIIDSVRLGKDGSFKFAEASLAYPEFYLLSMNGQKINLSVDSTEAITVKAPKETFASDYTIEGSSSSSKIKDIVIAQNKLSYAFSDFNKQYNDKKISQEEYVTAVQSAMEEYKTQARNLIYSDYNSPAAYFALFQKVDGYLIFDPFNKKDLAVFQAVATVWDQYKSASPRAEHLKTFTLSALANIRNMANQEEALKNLETAEVKDYSSYYDISLYDRHNQKVNLSSLRGKVVILDFTAYQTDFSPARNIIINNVYNKYKGNVEVYQVSVDTDNHAWQNSAVNLPWVCVRIDERAGSDVLQKYNIQGIPTTFLISKKGEIAKRMSSSDDLATEVQKLL